MLTKNLTDFLLLKPRGFLAGKWFQSGEAFRGTCTATMAIVASSLVVLITPVAEWFGDLSFFCPLMTILSYSGFNLGQNFVIMVWCLIGSGLGSGAAVVTSIMTGTGHEANVGLILTMLFVYTFVFSYMYAKYPAISSGFMAANLSVAVLWRFIFLKECEKFYETAFSFGRVFHSVPFFHSCSMRCLITAVPVRFSLKNHKTT